MANFLTRLTRPKLWDGYPLILSCAVGDIEDDLLLTLKGYDAAGTLLATNQSTATSFTDSVVNFNVNEVYGSFTGVTYITAFVETGSGEILTDTLTIDIETPCANPIYLIGRNSLGGALCWMFDVNQEYTLDYTDSRKSKRLLMSSYTSANQWDALQDFITLGEVYQNNIVEFTSDTIKTSTRVDQQIYSVDTESNQVGVIAIPNETGTQTRKVKHIFSIELEFPEIL